MKFTETSLPGVQLVTLEVHRDNRGEFCETWNQRAFTEAGLPSVWVQDNFSFSAKNVLRGIHYQLVQPQGKLVRVTQGAALDVAVDLRRSSPSFGRSISVELAADKPQMLYIPAGYGHGFLALSDGVGFAFKVTDYYYPEGVRTICWNDPDIGIDWPIDETTAILTDRDRQGTSLRIAEVFA